MPAWAFEKRQAETAAKLINNCLNKFLLMTCVPSRRDGTLISITTDEITYVSPAGTNTFVGCCLSEKYKLIVFAATKMIA